MPCIISGLLPLGRVSVCRTAGLGEAERIMDAQRNDPTAAPVDHDANTLR